MGTRLRRSDPSAPGWTRRRHGRGFRYLDQEGRPLPTEERARVTELVIPPAWTDVWICPDPRGHIQATGVDSAGRRQYLYHPRWRELRDAEKFDRVLRIAGRLPAARARWTQDLARPGLCRERVLAAAARLLDLGFFRVGGDAYAEGNGSYGLATMLREHVTCGRAEVQFEYTAKGGKERVHGVADPDVCAVVAALKRRRGGPERLLGYRSAPGHWAELDSADLNAYLKETVGEECSAKDFRTWHATVLAAVGLAVSSPVRSTSATARRRAVARVMREVAGYLGNTPAVCRASYVDPRVVERFEEGRTIADSLVRLGEVDEEGALATRGAVEEAVCRLLA